MTFLSEWVARTGHKLFRAQPTLAYCHRRPENTKGSKRISWMERQCKAINIRWTDDKAKMLNVQREKRHSHLFYLCDKRHDYFKTFHVFFIKTIEKTTTEWDTGTDEHSSECSSNSAIVFTHRYISHGDLVEMQFVASAGSYGTFGTWIIMNSALFKKKNWKQRHTHTQWHRVAAFEFWLCKNVFFSSF